ncbi:universal stress protein [Streptomyces sp. SID3343]|uniref:universal stress protein n=1 Tax=Streptomyces sp. SID3343 TaxID=2690260 RepID=UPI0013688669|nr:universal stress protein [Streptomyces sp. SID3343]MYV97748.1 universal stress protein [Streptomyces sp. SID3343]
MHTNNKHQAPGAAAVTARVHEVYEAAMEPHDRRRRVVVGLDGSYGCVVALRWAAKQARERGSVLDVVAVWQQPDDAKPDFPGSDAPVEVARERLRHALAELFRDPEAPTRVLAAPIEGPPGSVLVNRAKEAELLVLGTTSIHSPENPGGVGLYCLRHSRTPVVFVPAPE